jgi:hypothetical protein
MRPAPVELIEHAVARYCIREVSLPSEVPVPCYLKKENEHSTKETNTISHLKYCVDPATSLSALLKRPLYSPFNSWS